ncbi:uncharacterized protein LOC143859389 [Tasmannia lanceolata]|uniref:uncharacterized protein LOC143859389 n=1 Tax=Tasmannia lanceolata TaxID=3420 RepID=UPI0040641029
MEFLQKSSIENEVAEVMQVEHESCWMDEIIEYLRSGKLPETKKEARKVKQRAARFSLDGERLYKRSYTLPYLKCLRPSNAAYALQETHEGICGEHLGGKALAIKMLLRGLYWPTLRQDALDLRKSQHIPRSNIKFKKPANASESKRIKQIIPTTWGREMRSNSSYNQTLDMGSPVKSDITHTHDME